MNALETLHTYCCLDSAVTFEVNDRLGHFLNSTSEKHYRFNIVLLNALLYIELRGIKYDKEAARRRLKEVQEQIYEAQFELDRLTSHGVKTTDKLLLRSSLRDTMCYVKDPSKVKANFLEPGPKNFDDNMRVLLGEGDLTKAQLGRLGIALDLSLNVKSGVFTDYLYETLKLPPQRDKTTDALTKDFFALLKLKKKTKHPVVEIALRMTELRTRATQLSLDIDPDGRIRSAYNLVGSETGRVTTKKSPTGTGRNAQATADDDTLKDEDDPLREGLRSLLVADPNCYLVKCDLKGADGWTVAANLAALGDNTMLEDLKSGVKPAQVLCLAMRLFVKGLLPQARAVMVERDRSKLKELCLEVKKDDWDYFACKQVIWGFCYLLGAKTAAEHVFKVSQGNVEMTEAEMQTLKNLLLLRYLLPKWWKSTENRLLKQPYPPKLTSPSGHTRKFFGRRQEILGEALAHEPQNVTTYAVKLATYKCWTDPENRIPFGNGPGGMGLRAEILHTIHDELLFHTKIEDTPWTVGKIKSWFNNPIKIAGIDLVIPFEGTWGTDWAMNDSSKKGSFQ